MVSIDLAGKIAFVTGSSRGIGLAIADRLAAAGACVVLNGQEGSERLDQAVAQLKDQYGCDALALPGDVSQAPLVGAMMQAIFKKFGRLDILVNNAGIMRDAFIGMIPAADISSTLGVNTAGTLNCIQASARLMGRTGGSMINISSIMGVRGNVGQLVYSASKGAILAATYSAAKELAPKGIRVNAIAPGFIETDLVANLSEDLRQQRMAAIAMGRGGTPEEVAEVALFLASDLSRYVTGQVIGVDGGMLV